MADAHIEPEVDEEHVPRAQFEKSSDDGLGRGLVRGKHEVFTDEKFHGPPVGSGEDQYPTPVDYFLTSLIGCQASILAQCLDKARIDEFRISADADIKDEDKIEPELPEEAPEKFVIDRIETNLSLEVPSKYETRATRCLEVYDEACIVGQSIAAGVDYSPNTTLTLSDD